MSDLTPQQEEFVSVLVLTGASGTEAARQAGYAQPKQRAYELLRNPNVIKAIQDEQGRLINGDLTNVALGTLRSIMVDDKLSPSARVGAARAVLEYSNLKNSSDEKLLDKELGEMSLPELEAFLLESQKELARLESLNTIN